VHMYCKNVLSSGILSKSFQRNDVLNVIKLNVMRSESSLRLHLQQVGLKVVSSLKHNYYLPCVSISPGNYFSFLDNS
jgi:hypothetical protein